MNKLMLKLHFAVKNLVEREEGQDLVEYALLIALIAFACVAGMGKLANDINATFTALGTQLTSAT
jgi:pilus assembly protein Flp/PilA